MPTLSPVATRACLVTLAGSAYALEGGHVQQVVSVTAITPVPRTPGELLGLFAVRGVTVPLVDVRPLLGLPTRTQAVTTAVLTSHDNQQLALVVDEVTDYAPLAALLTTPTDAPFVKGEMMHQDGVVSVLDVPRIFTEVSSRLTPATPASL